MTIGYSIVYKTNSTFPKDSVADPVGVFVGATSGIGEFTAYEFAKVTSNPTIYISGRSAVKGAKVEARIMELNPSARVHFLEYDLIYIEQAERLANAIRNNEDKVNVIMLSQGLEKRQQRSETSEGLDEKLTLAYYGRWLIVKTLIPLLQKASRADEPARVLTVQGAGIGQTLDINDLELKNDYTPGRAEKVASAYNSVACLIFARKYSDISFTHSHPGYVVDPELLPMWYKILTKLTFLSARTLERSGQYHLYELYTGKEFDKGPHLVDQYLGPIRQAGDESSNYSVTNQDVIWKHTEDMIKRVVKKDSFE